MPDRRRFAIVVTPIVALLAVAAAVLWPSGAAPAAAQGAEPEVTCFEITPGWSICAAPAVAPTQPPGLRYTTYDPTGQAATPGSYAFLDEVGAVVTTYEGLRDRGTTGLVIHETDSAGASQEALYDLAQAGDIVEWRKSKNCWIRYLVTSVSTPAEGATTRDFGVKWVTYTYTDCSGAIPADTIVSIGWDPPSLDWRDVTSPVWHGPFILTPGDRSESPVVSPATYPGPTSSQTQDGEQARSWPSTDPAVVQTHPLWREPDLPGGWVPRFLGADVDIVEAWYGDAEYYNGLEVFIVRWHGRSIPVRALADVTYLGLIDGNPAVVEAHGSIVILFDESTGVKYGVYGHHPSLRENAEAMIAIARSLLPGQDELQALRYTHFDAAGEAATPGRYAFLDDGGDVVTTYEGLRDGTATGLRIHTSDAYGQSQAGVYDAVAVGDLFEWREADDCFVRYTVTEVKTDPAGTSPRKEFAIEWMTYAFTGCSGAISSTATASFAWGPLPDLGGPSLTAPVIHGIYQLVPEGWTGTTETGQLHHPPGVPPGPFMGGHWTETDDLTDAHAHPYWREPDGLPTDVTFSRMITGGYDTTPIGYCAVYVSAEGFTAIVICGDYAFSRRYAYESSWIANERDPSNLRQGVLETRVIAGRPARVQYSPLGPNHSVTMPTRVWIYDPATETQYEIDPFRSSFYGANIDAVIAIARSLFEPPNAP